MDEEEFNENDTSQEVEKKANKNGMGDLLKEEARKAKNQLKSKIWKAIVKYIGLKWIILGAVIFALSIVLVCVITYTIEATESTRAAKEMLNSLGVEDVRELVEIKKDTSGDGYHLEFIEDFDKKIEKSAEKLGKKYADLKDPELWKYFFLADIATQFPDLGGSGEAISSTIGYSSNGGNGGTAQKGDFWWPIGSAATTTKNGKTYADGIPEIPLGSDVIRGGTSRGWSTEGHPKTTGEALDIDGHWQIGHYNVISMAKGTVEKADDGYPNNGPNSDNGGMGNCVYVRYPGNILIRYMHLAQGTVAVKVGDEVDYGQVLGKMGHSGESYSPHLHIDMWIGAENSSGGLDVAQYIGERSTNNTENKTEEDNNSEKTQETKEKEETLEQTEQEGKEEENNKEEEKQTTSSSSTTSSGTNLQENSKIKIEDKEFQGGIKLIRITPDKAPGETVNNASFKTIEMKYVDKETFDSYISSGSMDALSRFTLTEDTKQMIIAVWSYDGTNTTLSTNTIDYLPLIEQFRMPFEYPMIFQIHGGDEEFSKNLAILAINSKFEIAIMDNVQSIRKSYSTSTTNNGELVGMSSAENKPEEEVNTVIELAGVNAWWVQRTSQFASFYEYKEEEGEETVINEHVLEDGTVEKTTAKEKEAKGEYKTYLVTSNYESKEQDFIDIFNKSKIKGKIQTSWLFEFLKNNDNTKNMVELTKYLLYKATGKSYGVKDFKDLGLIDRENEIDISSVSGNNIVGGDNSGFSKLFDFIASWENGALWHYMKGDSGYSYNGTEYIYKCVTEDKKNYLCVEDIGMNNGTRNFGFGVMHWHNGTWNNVEYYSEQGINIKQDKYTIEGTTMPVEIVDNVKKRIIDDKINNIKNQTQGVELSDAQIASLVAISYQYGNIGNFISAYQQYGNTDALKNNFYVNGYLPWVSGVGETNGRPQANWTLFHEGRYIAGGNVEI